MSQSYGRNVSCCGVCMERTGLRLYCVLQVHCAKGLPLIDVMATCRPVYGPLLVCLDKPRQPNALMKSRVAAIMVKERSLGL